MNLFSVADSGTTIAAVCTAPGPAAISIVRLSGPDALPIASSICPKTDILSMDGGRFVHTGIFGKDGEFIDDAVVLVFRKPHSYTGEDTVEFQTHGGRMPCGRLMSVLCDAGAVPAAAGEFTCRAFLNGRLDLSRAEAVMDMISAQSVRAARAAGEQLRGSLERKVNSIYDEIMDICADIEAALDFLDEETDGLLDPAGVPERLQHAISSVKSLASTWNEGRLLREGALVVLAGAPNAGKSTLFNAMLGTFRAIVNENPGTTRDSIEENMLIDGIPIRIADTAGIRDTSDAVEMEGVARAMELASAADIELHVVDASSRSVSARDWPPVSCGGRQRKIIVFSKSDIAPVAAADGVRHFRRSGFRSVAVSAVNGTGLDELKKEVVSILGFDAAGNEDVAVSGRHRLLLDEALLHLTEGLSLFNNGMEDSAVFCAGELRTAAEALGGITGRNYGEDLLESVFARFCVGK